MAFIELSTTRTDEMTISADCILTLLRGAGFEIPEGAVLCERIGNEIMSVGELIIRSDLPPTVQRVKVRGP